MVPVFASTKRTFCFVRASSGLTTSIIGEPLGGAAPMKRKGWAGRDEPLFKLTPEIDDEPTIKT